MPQPATSNGTGNTKHGGVMPPDLSEAGAGETANDEDLARHAAAGDRTAFARLVSGYYDRIYRMAWRWCGTREAAEDVAQDVAIKLATAIRSFSGEAAFATWVWRVTYNTAIDHLRRGRRFALVGSDQVLALVDGASADTPETAAMDDDLWSAVRSLPPQQRDAVLLVYAQDMSHAEAAGVLEVSEKTVSWHLHEARKTLKTILEAAE
jgi:RNA polymerase sigma-70 factor (ECF subfamily)